jgi:hypothetical protein
MSKMASSSTTSTTVGTNLKAPPGSTTADGFVPRRSNRVSADLAQPDGDTWTERLAVCEGQGARLVIRSYYKNSRTTGRVWDEPPSGASNIQHATADMRKHADAQLNELQFTLDMIPPEENMDASAEGGAGGAGGAGDADGNKKAQGKKGGFLGRFRKKEKPKKSDDSKDLNLQRAIARSMADQKGGQDSDEPVVYYDPDSPTNMADDEALEMAKALSISESTNPSTGGGGDGGSSHYSEEEMFQRALEASQREAASSGVASYMPDHEALLYQSPMDTPMPHAAAASSMHDSHQDLDQKMAAKPEATRPSELFDPYNNETSSQPASSSSMQGEATFATTAVAPDEPTSLSHPKMEAVDGKRKPGRKIARRVFGGKKAMEDEAGVV